ncbi:hypothetical protein BDW02DRAFT_646135 [Decorospora gaudefroyi]|uniref:P-loop containing nucleoside triphosphate hydrolase protein n=1 Tax=Decorospora gaudefroyi TaxID=184978 RepID=A0A6A5KS51_9PLEO|nr:hypothetical protein BDW02DRAFT_646135 [Decorospora gaudefroyi]
MLGWIAGWGWHRFVILVGSWYTRKAAPTSVLVYNPTDDFIHSDNLRSHGINRYINLPEIVVCGEQSSGKSSVLEAVSGVRFPSKDNLCTRFATELILRRGPDAPIKIIIVPVSQEQDRSKEEVDNLQNFHVSVSAENLQLEQITESAKAAMGINESSQVFSSDILRLELSGSDQPHLTLVDLPGLFEAGSRFQSDVDSETVKSLVLSYMQNPRSIILAVVSAKNDFNNQSITKHSRRIDPKGERTLGLITKPDTLDEDSDSERFYWEFAQNKDVKFRLGWHVLRNRDYISRNTSVDERDKTESVFFNTGIWRSLPAHQAGVHTLKPMLSKILKDHIRDWPHSAHRELQHESSDCILQISQSFSTLVRAAVDGQYSDPFFDDASTTDGYQKRLRAVIQNTLTEFATDMRKKGHTYAIIDEEGSTELPPHHISRADYVAKVAKLLERSRGRELPGTFDPLIIGQLFHEQRRPWAALVDQYLEKVLRAVYFLARTALAHVCDESTHAGLSRRFIYIRIEKLTAALRSKVAELLKPHESGQPITYNHYLTDNVQKAQSKRRAQEVRKCLENVLGGDYTAAGVVEIPVNVNALINTLVSKTEAGMTSYASSTATDFMEAFYNVAMKKIIDDFSVLAVEAHLIQELPSLFTPADIIDMDDAAVASLASESDESATERTLCSEKLKVLEDGLRALQNERQISSPPQDFDQELMQELEWKKVNAKEPTNEPDQTELFESKEECPPVQEQFPPAPEESPPAPEHSPPAQEEAPPAEPT